MEWTEAIAVLCLQPWR